MMAALEHGLWPGVDGCGGIRTTYGQFYFFPSALVLALETFAGEKGLLGPSSLRSLCPRPLAYLDDDPPFDQLYLIVLSDLPSSIIRSYSSTVIVAVIGLVIVPISHRLST